MLLKEGGWTYWWVMLPMWCSLEGTLLVCSTLQILAFQPPQLKNDGAGSLEAIPGSLVALGERSWNFSSSVFNDLARRSSLRGSGDQPENMEITTPSTSFSFSGSHADRDVARSSFSFTGSHAGSNNNSTHAGKSFQGQSVLGDNAIQSHQRRYHTSDEDSDGRSDDMRKSGQSSVHEAQGDAIINQEEPGVGAGNS